MRLLLFHPGVARIDCGDCQLRWYDMQTGEPKTYTIGEPPLQKTYDGPQYCPCKRGEKCPKESPEKAKDYELRPENWQALRAWKRHRAAPYGPDDLDELDREIFTTIDAIFREWESSIAAKRMAVELADLLIQLRR